MSLNKKEKIFNDLHKRMAQTYGEGYATKVNSIKDEANSPAALAAQAERKGIGKMIKPKKKPKVYKDESGGKFVVVPVSFKIPLYLEHGEKNLTLNDIKNRLDGIDSMELVDLVFDAMDYKNVIKG